MGRSAGGLCPIFLGGDGNDAGTLASGTGLWTTESFLLCPAGGKVTGILSLSTGEYAGGCFVGVKVGAGAKETAGVTCTGAFSGDSLGGGAKAPLSILIGGGAKGCEKDEFGLLGDKNGTSSVVFGGGEADKGGDASGGCDIDPLG